MLEEVDTCMQKSVSRQRPYTKVKMDHKSRTIKLLEDNKGENPGDHGCDNNFLDLTPNAQSTKENIGKLDLIKTKNFHSAKALREWNNKIIDWEKIFAKYVTDKRTGTQNIQRTLKM